LHESVFGPAIIFGVVAHPISIIRVVIERPVRIMFEVVIISGLRQLAGRWYVVRHIGKEKLQNVKGSATLHDDIEYAEALGMMIGYGYLLNLCRPMSAVARFWIRSTPSIRPISRPRHPRVPPMAS